MTSDNTGPETTRIGAEIERKFLLRDRDVVAGLPATALLQGYFASIEGWSVRLRTAAAGGNAGPEAWLTLKSATPGSVRQEIERALSFDLARRLLGGLPPERLISKHRYRLPQGELVWEIDRFLGRHEGLWLAEVELPSADYPLDLPAWLGAEVTGDARYRNEALAASGDVATAAAAPPELADLVRRLLLQTGQGAAVPGPAQMPASREREARLAARLRANLLRRKQQARNRNDGAPVSGDAEEPAPDGPARQAPGLDREDGSA